MDYSTMLREMFPNKTYDVIENIIHIVEEASPPEESPDGKLESMVNLLSEIGGSSGIDEVTQIHVNDAENRLLDEAANFPAAFEDEFEKKVTEVLVKLQDMLPSADPSYLEKKAKEYSMNPIELEDFITNATENNDYPTLENYLKTEKEKSEKEKYLSKFRTHEFLKKFPNPIAYFNDPERKHALSSSKPEDAEKLEKSKTYAINFLSNQFRLLRGNDIRKVFNNLNHDVVRTAKRLKTIPRGYRQCRKLNDMGELPENIPLLQELAYIKHEDNIKEVLRLREQNYLIAKENGLLETCKCCYYDELIPEECYFCKKDCVFCKDCVKQGTEVQIGQQKSVFPCLSNCDSEFSLNTLQMVLDPIVFKRLFQKHQMESIDSAGIEGLEKCPLCFNFAMIPNPSDKIFHCLECLKDSCRECKHESHIPLRCNEIEYDEDVKIRTYIENKMTEALVRKCWQCGKPFVKSSGCNKITCSCGAIMCYLCGAKLKDYSHFNNEHCPLFTDDTKIHTDNVLHGANAAKNELGVDVDPKKLKFDPTKDFAAI